MLRTAFQESAIIQTVVLCGAIPLSYPVFNQPPTNTHFSLIVIRSAASAVLHTENKRHS